MASMETSTFFDQLSMLAKAGVPMSQGLIHLLPSQHHKLKTLTKSLAAELAEGKHLGEACRLHHRGRFTESQLACIEAAEESGQLETMLSALAKEEALNYQLRQKLLKRIAYPALLIHAAAILPSIITLSQGSPFMAFLETLLWLAPFYLAGFTIYYMTVSGEADSLYLKIPFLNRYLQCSDASRFYRTLATQLQSGARIEHAWLSACQAMGNSSIAQSLKKQLPSLQQGEPFSTLLMKAKVFPDASMNLLAAGELSGTLVQTLNHLTELLSYDAERAAEKMTVAFSAVAYALAVGIIVFRILQIMAPLLQTLNEVGNL